MIHIELESIVEDGFRILDVGGKDGGKVAGLDGHAVTIDIELRPEYSTMDYALCDGRRMPFKDDSFDIVHCQEVLEHLERKAPLIEECARVLKPDGVAHFSFPNRFTPIKPHNLPRYWSFLPRRFGILASDYLLSEENAEYYKNHSYNLSPVGARRLLHSAFNDVSYVSMDLSSKYRELLRGEVPERYDPSPAGKILGEYIPLVNQLRIILGVDLLIELFYPGVMYRCQDPK